MAIETEHDAGYDREELERSFRASEAASGPITAIGRRSGYTVTEHDFMGDAPARLHLVVEGGDPPPDEAEWDLSGPGYISNAEAALAVYR